MVIGSKWNRYLPGILFGVLFFSGAKTPAITIDDYNKLSDDDAHRLLIYLADGAIKYLNTHGDPAMAKKAKDYFIKGDDVGPGYVAFVMEAQIVAIANMQNAHDPTKPQYPVESAFAMALKEGGITGIPISAIGTFGQGFKPSDPLQADAPAATPSGH